MSITTRSTWQAAWRVVTLVALGYALLAWLGRSLAIGQWTAPLLVFALFVWSTLWLQRIEVRGQGWIVSRAGFAAAAGAALDQTLHLISWKLTVWLPHLTSSSQQRGGMDLHIVECWNCPTLLGVPVNAIAFGCVAGAAAALLTGGLRFRVTRRAS